MLIFSGTCALCCLFRETNSRTASFDPTNIYKNFRKRNNKDILNGRQQDAQEFWIRLMKLTDSEEISCTKFSKWFEHKIEIAVTCGNCNFYSMSQEDTSAHVIDILEKKTIQEAVDGYFGEQTVSYKCDRCNITSQATKTYFLKRSPKHLCLFLSRFENISSKIVQGIQINKQLQLSSYSTRSEVTKIDYELVSVINHIGKNLVEGHYTAMSCNSGIMYEFDDSHVRRTNVINNCDAYMLIYESRVEVCSFDLFIAMLMI